ncbi:MAG: response regulator transcription factor [Bacillota bacterium]
MRRQRILVVDDEASLLRLVEFSLKQAGYEVVTAASGTEALARQATDAPDLVILDIMLPDFDGLEVCRRLRVTSPVPIIFLSAKSEEVDRIVGLELGGDDYLTKPFSPRELVARVKALLRRSQLSRPPENKAERVRVGEIVIDRAAKLVQRDGTTLDLTRTEYDLLVYLVDHAGQALSREQLLDGVWGADYYGDPRVVDVHVWHLRQKTEADPANPCLIVTVRGTGYRLAVRPTVVSA